MTDYTLKVTGYYNDADFFTAESNITEEQLGRVKTVVGKMEGDWLGVSWGGRFPQPNLTENEKDWIRNFIPYGSQGVECHNLEFEYAPKITWTKIEGLG